MSAPTRKPASQAKPAKPMWSSLDLVEAVGALTDTLRSLKAQNTAALGWFKSHLNAATLKDLKATERTIMSAVNDFYNEFKPKLAELKANQESQKGLVQQLVTSAGRIENDVKRVLAKLEAGVGDPGDPGRLAELKESLNTILSDAQAGSAAAQQLVQTANAIDALVPEDQQTPPPQQEPPAQQEPPVEEPPTDQELPPFDDQRSRAAKAAAQAKHATPQSAKHTSHKK